MQRHCGRREPGGGSVAGSQGEGEKEVGDELNGQAGARS